MKTTFQMIHSSPHAFAFPDFDKLAENRTGHNNGHLGLWVSLDNGMMGSFGSHLYDVEICADTQDVSLTQLVQWSRDDAHRSDTDSQAFYRGVRAKMVAEGCDYLRLVENDGVSHMGVVLNFDAITSFKLATSKSSVPAP